jgi:hypothetical protein
MSNFFDINLTIQPRLTFPTLSAEGSAPVEINERRIMKEGSLQVHNLREQEEMIAGGV